MVTFIIPISFNFYYDLLVKLNVAPCYHRDDLVTAVASINFDPAVAYFADMQLAGKKLTRNEIR